MSNQDPKEFPNRLFVRADADGRILAVSATDAGLTDIDAPTETGIGIYELEKIEEVSGPSGKKSDK